MFEEEIEIKLILLGESGVGKTSIIKRYYQDIFNPDQESTLSTNFATKDLVINNKKIKLNLWDTIGQEKYRSLSTYFLKETEIVILVYSIASRKSFNELNYWYNLFIDNIGKNAILGVIGNKSDLISKQEVPDKDGIAFAKKHNALFAQISVKENKIGIDAFIDNLIREYLRSKIDKDFEILENREKGIILEKELGKNMRENDGGCCGGKTKARKKKYIDIIKNNKGYIHSIFLGENKVGKTSLIKRIKGEEFDKNERHTSSLNEVETNYTNSTMQINLKIYDASNDQKNQNIEKMKQCQIFYLVYDLSKNETLKKVEDLIKEIKYLKEGENNKKDFILVIIGNKKDLVEKNDNKNYEEEGKALSTKNNSIFFSVSALNNNEIQKIIAMSIESYINLS